MLSNFSYLFAVGPFAVFLALLLWKKMPLLKVSLITAGIIFLLQAFYWKILPVFALNSIVKGTLVAFDIFIIIVGAIFFLEVLKDIKIIDNISYHLEIIFKDYRIQVILLAWFFENFIEGTAGFGTPSTIVAPLLVGLGLPPLNAVIISLLGNSTSVAFGAAGTPIRVGFAGLNITSVPEYTALFSLVGFLVPVFMLWTMSRWQENESGHFREALPFALWAGLAFVVPSLFIVRLGQEFPSIISSIIGLGLVLATTRLGLFIPKNIRVLRESPKLETRLSGLKVYSPYALLILLLIVGKFLLGSVNINFPWGFKYVFNLFNPGWAFLLAGLPVALLLGRKGLIGTCAKTAFSRTVEPFLIIVAMSSAVQLMINSGNNLSGLPSSLQVIAKGFEIQALPFIAPFIGAFGSFTTGSATVANIMFGSFLNTAAGVMGFSPAIILALGVTGAAAGNMFALADVIAAEAVVGLKNETRLVIKGVILPCLLYLALLGIIGLIIV